MVVAFAGALEVIVLWMNANDGGTLQALIFDSRLTKAIFYVMLVNSACKFVTGFVCYRHFKQEYFDQFGGDDIDNGYLRSISNERVHNYSDRAQPSHHVQGNGADIENVQQVRL